MTRRCREMDPYKLEIQALAEPLLAEQAVGAKEAKELRKAVRSALIAPELRNQIAAALLKAEAEGRIVKALKRSKRPTVKPTPKVPAGPRKHGKRDLAKLVKGIKVGDKVWFERDGEAVLAVVNHLTEKTVTVEVADEKDIKAYKTSILDVVSV